MYAVALCSRHMIQDSTHCASAVSLFCRSMANSLLLLVLGWALGLCGTTELLAAVLALLACSRTSCQSEILHA